MKLPTDKEELKKILILIVMGSAFVIYGLVTFVIKPMSAKKKENEVEIKKLEGRLKLANGDISKSAGNEKKNLITISSIMQSSDQHVLSPRLGGNYLLGATEAIETYAAKADVKIQSVSEIGIEPLPRPAKAKEVFRYYAVRVSLSCTYDELIRLFKEIETANPLLCIGSVLLTGQRRDPEVHKASFDVQWPIWANHRKPDELRQKLSAASSGNKVK